MLPASQRAVMVEWVRLCGLAVPLSAVLLATGCTRDAPGVAQGPQVTARGSLVPVSPLADSTMGELASVAKVIAASLEDPQARGRLFARIVDRQRFPVGLDLRECDENGVVQLVLGSGAHRLAADPDAICQFIRHHAAVTLYMDRDHAMRLTGASRPIVTAVADYDAPNPALRYGFRSDGSLVVFPGDGRGPVPVLVVLPISAQPTAPSAWRPRVRVRQVPSAP